MVRRCPSNALRHVRFCRRVWAYAGCLRVCQYRPGPDAHAGTNQRMLVLGRESFFIAAAAACP
eukprot:54894-Rhodomonas_salina.1